VILCLKLNDNGIAQLCEFSEIFLLLLLKSVKYPKKSEFFFCIEFINMTIFQRYVI
jgi:hypothetical protein